jgi:hypothetical protein
MKKSTTLLSLLLALALTAGPYSITLAQAGATGSGSSAAGMSGAAGTPGAGGSAPSVSSGGGSPSSSPGVGGPSSVSGPTERPGARVGESPVVTSPSASPTSVTGDFVGRHTMTGRVTKLDHSTGKFSLRTPDAGTLDLHAPPSSLAGVNTGDTVVVEIAVRPTR